MTELRQILPAEGPEAAEAPRVWFRLPLDRGRQDHWSKAGAAPYHLYERTYYYDQDAGPGQLYLVTAAIGQLVGTDCAWRYSVGAKIRAHNDAEGGMEFLDGFTIGHGDVDNLDEAKRLAHETALAWLGLPQIPSPAPPIPNLDLVAPPVEPQTQLDFIRRRQDTVREFADHVHDEEYTMDPGMRATLARVADDLDYLLERVDELDAWGTEAVTELERLEAMRQSGELSDGHHSYNDLYDQRLLYHAHLAQRWYAEGVPVCKSRRHHTGEECFEGKYFIVVMDLVTGQVSQHYPLRAWDLFRVPDQELAPQWDGHDAAAAAVRLRDALALLPPKLNTPQCRCTDTGEHGGHLFAASRVFWCSGTVHTLNTSTS